MKSLPRKHYKNESVASMSTFQAAYAARKEHIIGNMNVKTFSRRKTVFEDLDSFPQQFVKRKQIEVTKVEKNKFASVALFCLHESSSFRHYVQNLVIHPHFNTSINIIILINCFFLVLDTVESFTSVSQITEHIFNLIFFGEFLLKIIAYGFIFGKHTYLRDYWNWVDFLVVCLACVNYTPLSANNFTALRMFRLVRPLKSINNLPNMKRFFNTLVNSLVDLSSIFLLMLFFYIFFAIFGLVMLDKLFDYRCRTSLIPQQGYLAINSNNPRLCGGTNECPLGSEYCLSAKEFYADGRYFMSPDYDVFKEKQQIYLNFGITNFESFPNALFTVFLVGQKDGWIDLAFMVMDGYNYVFSIIFFLLIVVVVGFFIVNLTVAVMLYNFEKYRENAVVVTAPTKNVFSDEQLLKDYHRKRPIQRKNNITGKPKRDYSTQEIDLKKKKMKRNHRSIKDLSFVNMKFKKLKTSMLISLKQITCFKKFTTRTGNSLWEKIKIKCEYIAQQPIFFYLVSIVILINTLIMCFERKDQPEGEKSTLEIINFVIVGFFCIEAFILIVAEGYKAYFSNFMNFWDFVILLLSIVDIVFWLMDSDDFNARVTTAFRTFRIFRVIKLIRAESSVKIAMASVKETVKRMGEYGVFLALFLLIFSLIGYDLFNGALTFRKGTYEYARKDNSIETEDLSYNFNSFFDSVLSVFMVLIGNNYVYLLHFGINSPYANTTAAVSYFIALILFGHITLVNIFLAYFIDNFQKARQYLYRNITVQKFLANLAIYNTNKHEISMDDFHKSLNGKSLKGLFSYFLTKKPLKGFGTSDFFHPKRGSKLNFLDKSFEVEEYNKGLKEGERIFSFDEQFEKIAKEEVEDDFYHNMDPLKGISIYSVANIRTTKTREIKSYTPTPTHSAIIRSSNVSALDYSLVDHVPKELNESASTVQMYPSLQFVAYHDVVGVHHSVSNRVFYVIEQANSSRKKLDKIPSEQRSSKMNKKSTKDGDTQYKFFENVVSTESAYLKTNQKLLDKTHMADDFDNTLIARTLRPIGGRKKNYIETLLMRAKKKAYLRSGNWCAKLQIWFKSLVNYMKVSSFMVFHPDGFTRRTCNTIKNSSLFNNFIYLSIFISTILVLIDSPWIETGSAMRRTLDVMSIVFTCIFSTESLIKSVAQGFIWRYKKEKGMTEAEQHKEIVRNENKAAKKKLDATLLSKSNLKNLKENEQNDPYLSYLSNSIDFFVVVLGILEISGNFDSNLSFVRVLRILRSLRPLRIITKSESLKVIVTCCIKSIPALGHVLMLWVVFVLIYAILGVSLFKDEHAFICSDLEFNTEEDCLSAGKVWFENRENFNNFFFAFKTLFQLMNAEQWNTLTYRAKQNSSPWIVYLYFISYLIIGFFFILNLLISVVVQKFKVIKERANNSSSLRDEEVDWVKVQKIMMKFRPKKKDFDKKNSNIFVKAVDSDGFEYMIIGFIFVSIIVLGMHYNGSSEEYNRTLEMINYVLIAVFNAEMIMKIFVYKQIYFKMAWNIFDFVIVLVTDVILLTTLTFSLEGNISSNTITVPVVIRCFRIFRIFRVLTSYSKIRSLIDSLVYLIPSVGNIGSLLIIVFFIFGAIGMNIFGTVAFRNYINYNNNFKNIFSSVLILFRTCTGEGWNYIMEEISYHNCTVPGSPDYLADPLCADYGVVCLEYVPSYEELEQGYRYCGTYGAYFFFIVFIVVTPLFIMNLCVVLVIEGFSDSMYENESLLSQEMMDIFVNSWIKYDPNCQMHIKPYEFVLIMKQMCPPLGFNYDRYFVNDPQKLSERRKKLLSYKNMHFNNKRSQISNLKFDLAMLTDNAMKETRENSFGYFGFYTTRDFRFFTNDLELMRFLDKFSFYDTLIKKDGEVHLNDMKINFVDACCNLSKLVISKKYKINQLKLREDLVKDVTTKMWAEAFEEGGETRKTIKLTEKFALKVISKVQPQLHEKLKKIRKNLKHNRDYAEKLRKKKTVLRSIDKMNKEPKEQTESQGYLDFNISGIDKAPSEFSFLPKDISHKRYISDRAHIYKE